MDNFVLSDILRVPISYIIKGAYYLIPNYAIALLLFAIVVKVLLFPLGIKQQKNMVKQVALQPKTDAIKKRYAGRNDQATQQKMNQEIMDLYQKENYNPMGGCLPMLLQLPILFSLYNVIVDPLKYLCNLSAASITAIGNKISELTVAIGEGTFTPAIAIPEKFLSKLQAGTTLSGVEKVNAIRYLGEANFSEWLNGVTLPDFSLFGVDLSQIPEVAFDSFAALFLLTIPVLSFLGAFFSMRLTKKLSPMPQNTDNAGMNASMKMMDWMMPLMSLWIAFSVPAVIGIYWIYQNVLGTVQQLILKKMYPAPVFTPEQIREIEREMNGKVKKEPVQKSGKKVRSLHHIDDEDYDNEEQQALPEESKPKKKSPVADMIAPAELQDERDEEETNSSEEE